MGEYDRVVSCGEYDRVASSVFVIGNEASEGGATCGRRMRCEVPPAADDAKGSYSSPSTETPVVLGESGVVDMCAGRVCRFSAIGVRRWGLGSRGRVLYCGCW